MAPHPGPQAHRAALPRLDHGFFFIGGAAAALMRLELMTPARDLFQPAGYNRLFTIHGVIMVWLFLIPSIPTTLGNFLVPLMIGSKDLALPRINLASWYLFVIGGVVTIAAMVIGGVDTGWTFYTQFSSEFSNTNVVLTISGIFITGFSAIAAAKVDVQFLPVGR